METVRWMFAMVAYPVMWLIDKVTVPDSEYERLIAEQRARNIARYEGE